MNVRDKAIDEKISSIQDKTDDLEQRDRLKNLRIFGVKEEQNESTDSLVIEVATKTNVSLQPGCISRSHRVGPKNSKKTRAIIVNFVSYADRKKFFQAKKKLKGSGISIREDLTKIRQKILERASAEYGPSTVWSNDGVIVIKIGETYHRVKTENELDTLMADSPAQN